MAAIIHNSGVNYTLYYNVLNYFKTIMDNHPSIQIVTQGLLQDFDTKEFPQYPVSNVSILRADFIDTVTEYEIQLIIADKIKNKNNESNPLHNTQIIPFYGVDDVVDIYANALGIINDLTSYTQKSVDGFEILETISNEPFEDRFNNGLAGWVSTFTLTVHNDRNRCLFPLLSQPSTTSTTSTTLSPTTSTTTLSVTTSTTTLEPTTSTTTIEPTTTSTTTEVPTTSTTTLVPTTSTTTIEPTTSTTTVEPTTSTTTLVPTTSTTTEVPTTSTTTLEPTTSTTTAVPTTTQAPSTTTTTVVVYTYYSNRTEGNGFNGPDCGGGASTPCITPIYSTISSLSGYVCNTTKMYSDITLTSPWGGASEWFGLTPTVSGSADWYYPMFNDGTVVCVGSVQPTECI